MKFTYNPDASLILLSEPAKSKVWSKPSQTIPKSLQFRSQTLRSSQIQNINDVLKIPLQPLSKFMQGCRFIGMHSWQCHAPLCIMSAEKASSAFCDDWNSRLQSKFHWPRGNLFNTGLSWVLDTQPLTVFCNWHWPLADHFFIFH